ncbi:MAG: DoxX family protein [Saprospiraceae bacterium]|jgi:putative oxidoreductase|nr:MAG: DoxX family protein [Bacteroidota bacterium]
MKFTNQSDLALLLLRVTFGGLMFINHGMGKAAKVLAGELTKFGDPIGLGPEISLILAAFAEAVCAILLVVGLFTRWAAIPLIITMAVAVFVVHIDDPFKKMEMGLLYLTVYLAIFMTGPGRFSIDEQFRKI